MYLFIHLYTPMQQIPKSLHPEKPWNPKVSPSQLQAKGRVDVEGQLIVDHVPETCVDLLSTRRPCERLSKSITPPQVSKLLLVPCFNFIQSLYNKSTIISKPSKVHCAVLPWCAADRDVQYLKQIKVLWINSTWEWLRSWSSMPNFSGN